MQVFQDPNRINLRKAGRAMFVTSAVFVAFTATGDDGAALFAAMGSFGALVFADYGGPLPRRFRAYALLAAGGGALAALGTALSDTTVAAVAVTLLVAFAVSLSGALGGYFAASTTTATLAYVLAVMTPGIEADLVAREVGWVVGVIVAGVAAVVLWPVHQRDRVRQSAAVVLREAAVCLAQPPATRDLSALRAADDTLTTRAGLVYRPSGSITRERALVALVVGARRLANLVAAVTEADRSTDADPTPEYAALTAAVAASLYDTARTVERGARGDAAAEPERVAPLVDARTAHTTALEQWSQQTVEHRGATRVVEGVAAAFPLRRLSFAALQLATSADEAAHDVVRSRAEGEATIEGGWDMLRAHCHPRSVRFRNAARGGVGLALAVLVARATSIDHAFWVVLGALSVLRSNALGTGATALQALVGVAIGFGLGSVVMLTVGGDTTWLWILLPLVAFLAAYTPGAVNFVVGQAAFTVFVVVLFNILVPQGWRTGLVRLQDVAIGAGISVAVGALLWPRGARGVARRSFADLVRAGADQLGVALDRVLSTTPTDLEAAARRVADARARAVAALEDLSLEHGGGHVDRQAWSALLLEGVVLELAADGVLRACEGRPRGCGDARHALAAEGHEVVRSLRQEADRLVREGARALSADPSAVTAPPPELAACLDGHRDQAAGDGSLDGALGLVWVHEWLTLVEAQPR